MKKSDGPFSIENKSIYVTYCRFLNLRKTRKRRGMEDLKLMARAAKQRLKNNFWEEFKKNLDEGASFAREKGLSETKVKSTICGRVQKKIKGEKQDEFYLKVKNLLDTEGEVSDALGRLTDREYYDTLSYEEKQRYSLELSAKYLKALERYKKEKELLF